MALLAQLFYYGLLFCRITKICAHPINSHAPIRTQQKGTPVTPTTDSSLDIIIDDILDLVMDNYEIIPNSDPEMDFVEEIADAILEAYEDSEDNFDGPVELLESVVRDLDENEIKRQLKDSGNKVNYTYSRRIR